MIAVVIGTVVGTLIAFALIEWWRAERRAQLKPPLPGLPPGTVEKMAKMTPAERQKFLKEGKP